jgi:hypothetical protein
LRSVKAAAAKNGNGHGAAKAPVVPATPIVAKPGKSKKRPAPRHAH